MTEELILKQAEIAMQELASVRQEVAQRIIGQDHVVELTLAALLSGGHALLVGAPGLAKTKLVETLGTVTGLDARRVQFTPDLMPADILGSEVLEEGANGQRAFRFIKGPIFAQLLMADEINRASPRTQSALLQAMQEHHITVAGVRHELPAPFHVLATQNPIEQEGTYPLPEAQLDRFLVQIDIDYPNRDQERRILMATTGVNEAALRAVISPARLQELQRLVRQMPVSDRILEAILTLTRAARPGTVESTPDISHHVLWGPGPRAAQALSLISRARALLQGRIAPEIQDIAALAQPVLIHRMALNFSAKTQGITLINLIGKLVSEVLQ